MVCNAGEEAEGPRLQEGPQLKEGQQLQEGSQQQEKAQQQEGPKQRAQAQCAPVEVGGVWLPVEASTNGDCPACFPAAATALRKDGKRVSMGNLAVGDLVQVRLNQFDRQGLGLVSIRRQCIV